MRVLVTGGAGYIGSVTTRRLLDDGHEVRVLDDLSTGHRAALCDGVEFFEGRIQDGRILDVALAGVEAVIHFASLSLVGDSMRQPLRYFRENVGAAIALLDGMQRASVHRLVFSSSAAVYGEPGVEVIDEDVPLAPVNPYGHTKAMIERIVAEEARAAELSAISLRYFNACGAAGPLGEDHDPETHLIPRLCLHLLGRLDEFAVHGGDHETPDGTAVRDYVHVVDLAAAHALALSQLDAPELRCVNLGTETGSSVLEVLDAARRVTGVDFDPSIGPKREGDPARLVASHRRAVELLGWRPARSDLDQILSDAHAWHRDHPHGYGD